MNARRGAILWGLAVALWAAPAGAETPQLNGLSPRGAQRGTEVDVTFRGARLKDAKELFLYKPGLEVVKFEAGDASVKVRFRISADAPLGEHPVRVRTATGISECRTFYVGPYATVDEKEPNNDVRQAQKVPSQVTVAGVIQAEDSDTFAVQAKKGERVTAEVEGIRLGITLFDPYVAIFDPKGRELAECDDSSLFLQDPVVSAVAPEDGTYVVLIRETSYGGSDQCAYRLHLGGFPRPLVAYPAGGKAGETLRVTFLGDAKGPFERDVRLPDRPETRFEVYPEEGGRAAPSPNYVRISDYPNVLEAEPNNARDKATATDLPLPVALNGVIQAKGDEDWFRFKAKKGQTFEVKVHARSVRSPLDPVLAIYSAGGSQVASNDDQGGADSGLKFTAPSDGAYELHVRDHLGNGGPTFVYRVEFNTAKPGAYVHIPAYEREPQGQLRQWAVVPKGNRFAGWFRVSRSNLNGEVKISFEGLPAGVKAVSDVIPADVDRAVVVFEAAPDAPVTGKLVDVLAQHPAVTGNFKQEINLVLGQPNNTVYYGTEVSKLAVAVAEEAPFKLRLMETKAPLVRGGATSLKVVAERKPGFDGAITLRMLWSPPGIGSQGTVTMKKGETEADYPINANGNAATRTWKIAVLGSADGGYGTAWVSTQLAPLAVASPYVAMKLQRTSIEQGKSGVVVGQLEQLRPFEGKAKVTLLGVPSQVTLETKELEITKDDKEVRFNVRTDARSTVSQNRGLFCQVIVMENGEPVVHNVGTGGVLRIDPAKAPKAQKGQP